MTSDMSSASERPIFSPSFENHRFTLEDSPAAAAQPSRFKRDFQQKARKYMIENEMDIPVDFSFEKSSSFHENNILFRVEEETTLVIKQNKKGFFVEDKPLVRLELMSPKLQNLNLQQQQKSGTFLGKVLGMLTPRKKFPNHLRITKAFIRLNNCEGVGDVIIKSLASFLTKFENLTHLEIEAKYTEATDQSMGYISSLVSDIKQLTNLYIDFSGCKITDEGLFVLSNSLTAKPCLKELWFRFSWCTESRITNEGMHSIAKAIEKYEDLNVVLLEFNGATEITSKGISELLTAVKRSRYLKKLFLYFERAQASDNLLNYIAETILDLKSLDVFGLNVAHSLYLTYKPLEKLVNNIKLGRNLKTSIYLYLSGCLGGHEKHELENRFNAVVKSKKTKNSIIELD